MKFPFPEGVEAIYNYQNRNAEGTVGQYEELLAGTAPGGLGYLPKSSACDLRENASEPGGLEALP